MLWRVQRAFKYVLWAHNNLGRTKEGCHYLYCIPLIRKLRFKEKLRQQKCGRFKNLDLLPPNSMVFLSYSRDSKNELSQACVSVKARQVCPSPTSRFQPLFFLHWDIKNYWEIRNEQNINHSFDEKKNPKKIVIGTDYANLQYANVFSFTQECGFHFVVRLWFFFQMPCFNSTILQYFTECSMGQKHI